MTKFQETEATELTKSTSELASLITGANVIP